MSTAKSDDQKTGAVAQFEAEIRRNARPMLSEDETREQARKQAVLEARYAAARARQAGKSQIARAEA